MEPTDGQVSWGRSAWEFLHGVTLDPLAPASAKQAQKKLAYLLRYLLPCPYCRESYRRFSRDLDQVPAENMGDFFVEMHDCVNLKLEKQSALLPASAWAVIKLEEFREIGFPSYVEDMFFFLFTLAANYPLAFTPETQIEKHYRDFFQTLPMAMIHRPWGKIMHEYLKENPITTALAGRRELTKWLYGMYRRVVPDAKEFETIVRTMNKMRK